MAGVAAPARAAVQVSALGVDATQLGVNPASSEDQSSALQRAIDRAAGARVPLVLPPGVYRAANLMLPPGAALVGDARRDATDAVDAAPLIVADAADDIALSGLTFDGGNKAVPGFTRPRPARRTGAMCASSIAVFDAVGSKPLRSKASPARCAATRSRPPAPRHPFARRARADHYPRNTIRNAGNNGIQVWRSQRRRRRHAGD